MAGKITEKELHSSLKATIDNKAEQSMVNELSSQLEHINIEKAEKSEVRLKDIELDINDFNESSRTKILNQEGTINAVLGGQNVTKDNIKIGGVNSFNIDGCYPINVFNRETATYGKYLTTNGSINTHTNFAISDFIPCEVGDIFEIIGVNGENNLGGICGGVIYNFLKEVIGSFTTYKPNWVTTHGVSSWNNIYEITDSSACFVRFNILASTVDNTKMITKNYPYRNEDATITPYVEYGKTSIDWLDLDKYDKAITEINQNIKDFNTSLNGLKDNIKIEFGKTYSQISENKLKTNFYGFMNRIKAPKKPISQIKVYVKTMTTEVDYQCKVLSNDRKITYAHALARSIKNDSSYEYITFQFEDIDVSLEENIYVSIYSSSSDLKITSTTTDKEEENLIGTATVEYPTFYSPSPTDNGIPGYKPSPNTGYYMMFDVLCKEETSYNADGSIGLNKLSEEVKEYINSEKKLEKEIELFIPKKVFTWGDGINGDFIGNRVPKVGVYLDHMLPYDISDLDIYFENSSQKNRLEFTTPYPIDWNVSNVNNGISKQLIQHNFKVTGSNYKETEGVITQVSVKNNVGEDTHIALLTIGDSTVEGANAFITLEDGTYIWSPFWHEVARQFAMDSIEVDDINKYKFSSLGVRNGKGGSDIVEYLGKTRNIITATNGESGSKLADHLRYVTQKRPSQQVWDSLGLGDGTGADYKGTSEQKDLIARTCEVYSGTEEDFNGNPFFDNSKTGDNKFSITKWLERYRTLDDNGNRLTLGNGTGTKITNDNINKINVCTPTHVLLQTGLNDWTQVSVEQYLKDMDIFVREIKTQLPNTKIAITLFADDPGTYFKELYPDISDCEMRYLHDRTRPYVTALFEHFKDFTDVELLPFYFVMPPAISLSYRWVQNDDGTKTKVPFGPASNDYHANGYAHKSWSHQLYAWIKSTLV